MRKNIINLSNTRWSIIDNPGNMGTGINVFRVNFVSNDVSYTSMRFEDEGDRGKLYYGDTLIVNYPAGAWANEAYQKLRIEGGADATNPMLTSWLSKYAKNDTANAQTADITKALSDIVSAINESAGGGTEVIANPTLVGDESALSGLEVAGTKYKVAADVTIDTALDDSSTNPVQNKVVTGALNSKQATLVSGTNIKTINNNSILGTGNITISEGTEVIANPTLVGTEAELTGIQIGNVKFKISSGGDLDTLMQEEF